MSRKMIKEIRTNLTCLLLSIVIAIGTFGIVANVSPLAEPVTGYETVLF